VIRSNTFPTAFALASWMRDSGYGPQDITITGGQNQSGHIDILYDDADPTGVAAGAGAANVDLAEGARLQRIRVSATGGNTTLNILGLGSFTILSGDTFEIDWEGRYVGTGVAAAENRIAIGANSLYFVSWLDRS
jgi:hypothetical protein